MKTVELIILKGGWYPNVHCVPSWDLLKYILKIFLIGTYSMQGWTATMRYWLQKKQKTIKAYQKSVKKKPTVKRYVLNLDWRPFRSYVKGNLSLCKEFRSSCVKKGTVDIDIFVTSRKSDRKIMQSIRIMSRPPSRIRKWNQLSQFRSTPAKVMPMEISIMGTFQQWVKASIEVASEGPTVLHIRFCSQSNKSKKHQALAHLCQQYSMYGCMVDF